VGKKRQGLPVFLIFGSDNPLGQRVAGVRRLMERCREADAKDSSHDIYVGGRHEKFNEINKAGVRGNPLAWISWRLRQ
jgi:alpha-beta hydrolase superfamily lysophospholipase